ncbi:MAG: hypothetical protein F4Y79_20080 [Gemmatimonadetes bacterium]|nr:hypothetical protein [Gemmatimonadota bacterium]MYF18264.1 hypothetical protein [Gemmatimonadota bacterium]
MNHQSSLTLEVIYYPFHEYGYDACIQSGTDWIDDGVQVGTKLWDAAQRIRTCSSADRKRNDQVGRLVLSTDRYHRVGQTQNHQREGRKSRRDRVGRQALNNRQSGDQANNNPACHISSSQNRLVCHDLWLQVADPPVIFNF